MREEDGAVDDIGHFALGGFGDVVAECVRFVLFVVDRVLAEPGDGVCVFHAHKGAGGHLERRVEFVDEFGGLRVGEGDFDDAAHD